MKGFWFWGFGGLGLGALWESKMLWLYLDDLGIQDDSKQNVVFEPNSAWE